MKTFVGLVSVNESSWSEMRHKMHCGRLGLGFLSGFVVEMGFFHHKIRMCFFGKVVIADVKFINCASKRILTSDFTPFQN